METVDFTPRKKGLLGKVLLAVLILFVCIILAASSFYSISEQQQAVLTTFGKATAVTDSGLHFKIPFIQKVHKVNTTIQGFAIGYDTGNNDSEESESLMITSDYNFVNVDFFIEYRITEPVKAIYASENPELILKNIAQSCIRGVIANYDVDSVLTTGKTEIQSAIREKIIAQLSIHDIGLQLVNITIQDSEPPTAEVMEAFKAVETAKQGKETAINNANKYRNEQLPEAEAKVDKILKDAEATKQQRINEANGQVARFNAMYDEYIKNPAVTRHRMFYEAMEEILPQMKIIINGTNGDTLQTILPLDSFTQNSDSNTTR